ncbi:hypothetical protein F0562_032442 [Nyssa sinensis]|uniref:Uncharacterized protein n=1 Tax=Nyssa sinensis TaxID=561372 RepID=A0A5J5AQ57_9ASTE|nr:hypothetical protein F0562_032442 [Nyssa sinensis]
MVEKACQVASSSRPLTGVVIRESEVDPLSSLLSRTVSLFVNSLYVPGNPITLAHSSSSGICTTTSRELPSFLSDQNAVVAAVMAVGEGVEEQVPVIEGCPSSSLLPESVLVEREDMVTRADVDLTSRLSYTYNRGGKHGRTPCSMEYGG